MNRLKQAMCRELTTRNKAGAYLAALTCPCHVVMLLFLTGGTVVGTWLGSYNEMLYAVAAVLFIFGVWTMFRPGKSCPIQTVPRERGTVNPLGAASEVAAPLSSTRNIPTQLT